MSISCTPQNPGQHHEHQPHSLLPKPQNQAIIMSIGCTPCYPNTKTGQHHEHQPHSLSVKSQKWASMSIGRTPCQSNSKTRPASRASAALPVSRNQQPGQHHEHQSHFLVPRTQNRGSIMSISCTPCIQTPKAGPAS